jgi:hypothetical protein
MNYLTIANSFKDLFPPKVTVTFINAVDEQIITISKLDKTDLPDSFDKPITMTVLGESWRVVNVLPGRKKLTIYVADAAHESAFTTNYIVPTRAYPLPTTGNDINLWRQLEFLPSSLLPIITEEFTMIEAVIDGGRLSGYESCYERVKLGMPSYSLPVSEFVQGVMSVSTANSFSLKSEHNSYYGIIQDGNIPLLCLEHLDGLNDELMDVLQRYDMILVDWCNLEAISPAEEEE